MTKFWQEIVRISFVSNHDASWDHQSLGPNKKCMYVYVEV